MAGRGDLTGAVVMAQAAVYSDPSWSGAYGALGLAHAEAGEQEKARQAFMRANELDPIAMPFQANLGDLAYDSKRWEEAEVSYRSALSLKPDELRVRQRLALTLSARGQDSLGVEILEQAGEAAYQDAQALTILGSLQMRLGNLVKAEELLRAAVTRNSDFASGHYYLAATLTATNRMTEALVEARRAAELHPGEPNWEQLVRVLESKVSPPESGQ